MNSALLLVALTVGLLAGLSCAERNGGSKAKAAEVPQTPSKPGERMAGRGGVKHRVLAFRVRPTRPRPADVILPIADRAHAAGAPREGWCGESAIQQALLHFGAWVPQRAINRAGRPKTPDLYASDLPVALQRLGVRFTRWAWTRKGLKPFLRWVRESIKGGEPVLAGVKILPTQHPRWALDHFVLAVGYGARGLLVNTTWGSQRWLALKQLQAGPRGLSFKNRYGRYYGLRLQGLRGGRREDRPVGLRVVTEDRRRVTLLVQCSELQSGHHYVLERRATRLARRSRVIHRFTAADTAYTRRVTIPKGQAAWFRCRPTPITAQPVVRPIVTPVTYPPVHPDTPEDESEPDIANS